LASEPRQRSATVCFLKFGWPEWLRLGTPWSESGIAAHGVHLHRGFCFSIALARSLSLALVSCFRPISVPHPLPLPLPLPLRLPALTMGMSVLVRGFIEKKTVGGRTQFGQRVLNNNKRLFFLNSREWQMMWCLCVCVCVVCVCECVCTLLPFSRSLTLSLFL
jgi:hypothetical protein